MLWGFLRVLARRKWLTLAAFILVLAGSIAFLRTLKPLFRATARLTVESRTATDTLLKTPDAGPQQGYLETVAEVLRSRSLAEQVVTTLEFWRHPEYATTAGDAAPGPDGPVPPGLVDRLLANTSVALVPLSAVVNVSVQSSDPELAANAANGMVEAFIRRDLQSRLAVAKDATSWIARQLEEQRMRVTETEASLQRYRESQNAGSLDERQNIVVQRLGDLNTAVTRARTERIAKEELFKRVGELRGNRAQLDSVPAVAGNAYIQQLKGQLDQIDRQLQEAALTLGDKHPEMIRLNGAKAEADRRLAAEIDTLIGSVQNEFLTARAQEQSLTAALELQKREAQELDRKGVEYAALVREAESNRALYQSLLEQAKNVGMSSDLQRSNVRILDPATLLRFPINPVGRLTLLLAVIASLTFAVGLAFVVEYLDPRLRIPDEISSQLGIPLLGAVEQLPKAKDGGGLLVTQGVPPRFREAIAHVRANIEASSGAKSGVVLVTSSGAKEGKTLVGGNLALEFALAGRRVLLIDCDLRRSSVHSLFSLPIEPGLTTVLNAPGRESLEVALRTGPCPLLSILTAGPTPASPAEALGLSRQADHVVFVVAADITRRRTAKLAAERLRRVGVASIGAVLNRVAIPKWGGLYSPCYSDYGSYYNTSSRT